MRRGLPALRLSGGHRVILTWYRRALAAFRHVFMLFGATQAIALQCVTRVQVRIINIMLTHALVGMLHNGETRGRSNHVLQQLLYTLCWMSQHLLYYVITKEEIIEYTTTRAHACLIDALGKKCTVVCKWRAKHAHLPRVVRANTSRATTAQAPATRSPTQ